MPLMLYHSCEGPREEGHSCSWTSSEHGGTGGTWHSDVGFFHTAVGGFCVDSWGLWSTASAEGIRNSLGYSVLLSFFHRRGKILNN